VNQHGWVLAVVLGSVGMLRLTPAAEPPPDPGLLEFLGSVDSEDKNWQDYLARTDIDRVAGRPRYGRALPSPAQVPPPSGSSPPPNAVPPTKPPSGGSSSGAGGST
jgi:hypothetical protein